MKKRGIAAVALTGITCMLLSACTPAVDDSLSATQAESFPGVYAQAIDWGSCDEGYGLSAEGRAKAAEAGAPVETFECAMIEAPLDWNDPKNHETIELAAIHIPSTGEGEPLGTLMGNPGGPGASGIKFTASHTMTPAFEPVLEKYDLLGFDPRGIEASTPVECDDYSNVRSLQIAICAEEFPLAHSMGTSQVAQDMDLLRTLMGEDKLDYLGYSYGTILGATYATLFPDRVGRMVLDSAPDQEWASPQGLYTQSVAFATEIVAMLSTCESEYDLTNCSISTDSELIETMESWNEEPRAATDGTEVNGRALYGYLSSALYQGGAGRADALDTFNRAIAGDQSQIDEIAQSQASGGATISMAGQFVSCHSFPDDPDLIGLMETVEELGVPLLLDGPEITEEVIAGYAGLDCDALRESGDDLDAFVGPKDTTILVTGITGDHATPFEEGKNLARQLGNTRFLTLEGHGHAAAYAEKSTCIDDATTAFLLTGELPEAGTVCQAN